MSKWTLIIDATGSRGNIFCVIATARKLLKQLGAPPSEIADFTTRVENTSTYDDAIAVVREWFPVVCD